MEIVYPEFRMLSRNDPRAWEMTPVVYSQWAEYVLPQLGYSSGDITTFLLGYVLDMLVYDDGNAFGLLNIQEHYQLVAENMQGQLITRLRWETSLGVLPEDIQGRLLAIQETVEKQDWMDLKQIQKAHVSWKELKDFVEERIEEGGDLEAVFCGYRHIDESITPYWKEFLKINGRIH